MDASDHELLQRFATGGDERAFETLVRRYLDLVHAVARRTMGRDDLARDVAQATFIRLAQQAKSIPPRLALAAWLHRTCRSLAVDLVRAETRRQRLERAASQSSSFPMDLSPEPQWATLSPVIDELIDQLRPGDREVVLLRFYQNQTHVAVGRALGFSEEVARKRANRALARLRLLLQRRGVATTVAALATLLPAHGAETAPADLLRKVAAAACRVTPAGATLTALLPSRFSAMASSQKILALGALALLLAGTAIRALRENPGLFPDSASARGAFGELQPRDAGRKSDAELVATIRAWMEVPNPNREMTKVPPQLREEMKATVQRLSPAALETLMSDPDATHDPMEVAITHQEHREGGGTLTVSHDGHDFKYRRDLLDLLWTRYGSIAPGKAIDAAFSASSEDLQLPVDHHITALLTGVSKVNGALAWDTWRRYAALHHETSPGATQDPAVTAEPGSRKLSDAAESRFHLFEFDALKEVAAGWAGQNSDAFKQALRTADPMEKDGLYFGYVTSLHDGTDWNQELEFYEAVHPAHTVCKTALLAQWAAFDPDAAFAYIDTQPLPLENAKMVLQSWLYDHRAQANEWLRNSAGARQALREAGPALDEEALQRHADTYP